MSRTTGFIFAAALVAAVCPRPAPAQQAAGKRADRPAARATPAPPTAPAETPADTVPGELSPPTDDPADTPEPVTVIDAYERTTFTSKDRIAVFKGKVKVVDPRFQLVCDELTVFLNKTTQPGTGAATAPTPAPGGTPPANGDKPSGGGIDHAVARGHVVILQHRAATKAGGEEKISIGRGEEGTFDNKTGDMTLKGTPSIEQNGNTHVAVSPDTIMIIHRDGGLDTVGPAQTKLTQRKGGDGFDLPGGPTSPDGGKKKGAAPAPSAPPGGKRAAGTGQPHP